ncbi:MAG: prolyl oligopeptidase family serine peptidase [Candidatus Dormibacteraeota bacterium]|nr:prolyl oligopeptidase family serine peptidase [Candidatus Dormibacteraeota bacterium]
MRGARRLTLLATLAVCLLTLAPAAASAAAPTWPGWTGVGSGVFRDASYDHGEFIYSNGIFQSLGANADTLHRRDYYAATGELAPTYSAPNDLYNALTYDFFGAHRSTHNGDYQLPTDRGSWPDFTGDLAEVRLQAVGGDLFVRWRFTSFPRPDAQVATLAFAPAAAPGAPRPWPRNAGVSSPWTTTVTIWGTEAELDSGAGSQALSAAGGAFRANAAEHIFEARIPLRVLPSGSWSVTGGSGLDDPASPGHYWTVPAGNASAGHPGSGAPVAPGANVWDLLFSRDDPWTFDELKQADDLRGGDVSSDRQVVDRTLLLSHATRPAPPRTGDLSRFFSSAIGSADGIDRSAGLTGFTPPGPPPTPLGLAPLADFDVTYHYTGRLQPYYMHVPASYPARTAAMPLVVYLHGFTGLPDEPFYNPIGLVDRADRGGYLLASALGRGDYTYRGPGDIDVREVIADVEKHYQVDPDRVYLMGHSMGGYGTNNVVTHNPDLFAAVAPAEGTDSIDLHQNLRNVGWLEMTAEEDLDTGGAQAKRLYGNLSADGYDATLVDYKFKIHEYSSIYDTLPRIFAFFAAHRRNPNPAEVSYSRLPGEDLPEIGLVYDHAYWISGLRSADPGKRSDTHVESLGIRHARLVPEGAGRTDVIGDEQGPAGLPRTLRELFQTTPAYGPAVDLSNAANIETTNVSAMALDLARMGLRDDCALTLHVTADHALSVSLSGRTVAAPRGASTQVLGSALCNSSTGTGDRTPNTARGGPVPALPRAPLAAFAAILAVALVVARPPRAHRR